MAGMGFLVVLICLGHASRLMSHIIIIISTLRQIRKVEKDGGGMEGHHHIESGGHTLKYNFWDNAAKPLVFCNL